MCTLSCFVTESQLLQAQSQFLQQSFWREQAGSPSVVVSGVVFAERVYCRRWSLLRLLARQMCRVTGHPPRPYLPSTSPPPPGPPFIRFPRSAGEAPSAPGHPQLPRLYEPPSPSPIAPDTTTTTLPSLASEGSGGRGPVYRRHPCDLRGGLCGPSSGAEIESSLSSCVGSVPHPR